MRGSPAGAGNPDPASRAAPAPGAGNTDPGGAAPDDPLAELAARLEAVVIHSDMPQTLEFSCSHPGLNQLHHNILWGWKSNALDIPTDCPQRDERLGWTGDAQVFIGTATYLTNAGGFFAKWLRDLQLEQRDDGGVPFVIPNVLASIQEVEPNISNWHSSTGWGDAAVICPWTLAARYGDRAVLEEQWPSIMGWISYMRAHAEDEVLWNSGFHFGDWVALDAKEGSFFGATPNDLTATAYYAHSVDLAARIAERLEKVNEADSLRRLHGRIVDAFRREFYTARGRLAARTQTAHLLALAFDLVAPEHRARTVEELIATIRENDDHLVTGFLGTPLLLPVLAENGHLDEAYRLLLREEYPSWLFQVKQGATTIWEHWDGMKPDGSMWSPDMNSFNHYAYGAVGEWMYRSVGGLDLNASDIPAGRFVLAPRPPAVGDGSLTRAEMTYHSGYGPLRIAWRLDQGRTPAGGGSAAGSAGAASAGGQGKAPATCSLHLEVTVPPNCVVELHSPVAGPGVRPVTELGPGRHRSEIDSGSLC
jgi:alpha-L-rhamnosidase